MRMKKFIFYFCLCWGVITIVGCNKDDDFDSSDNYTDVTAIDESQNQSYVLLQEVPSDCQEEANEINASLLAKRLPRDLWMVRTAIQTTMVVLSSKKMDF